MEARHYFDCIQFEKGHYQKAKYSDWGDFFQKHMEKLPDEYGYKLPTYYFKDHPHERDYNNVKWAMYMNLRNSRIKYRVLHVNKQLKLEL